MVSAPSRSSWVVVCSESTCQRVGVRLLSRAQWRWRVGRLSAMLGPSQTALSWPSTAPLPAVSCGCKKQQMRWSKAGAHCLLQVKTAAINGQLQPFIATHPSPSLHDPQVFCGLKSTTEVGTAYTVAVSTTDEQSKNLLWFFRKKVRTGRLGPSWRPHATDGARIHVHHAGRYSEQEIL